MTNDLLQCALGVHRYNKELGYNSFLCSICERAGHYKSSGGYEQWHEYDEKGNMICFTDSNGYDSRILK